MASLGHQEVTSSQEYRFTLNTLKSGLDDASKICRLSLKLTRLKIIEDHYDSIIGQLKVT